MYRVLLVIPNVARDHLNTRHELQWISRSFRTESLTGHMTQSGQVTADDVLSFVTGRKFDVIHFATDGDEEGLVMDGGTRLDMDELSRIARTTSALLVYLAACRSARLAQYMVDQGVPAVIASTYDIQDSNAWSTASYFYTALLDTKGEFYRAYELAKPGDGALSFYSDGKVVHRSVQPILDAIEALQGTVEEFGAERVKRDERMQEMAGDLADQTKGLEEAQTWIRRLFFSEVSLWLVVTLNAMLTIYLFRLVWEMRAFVGG